MFLNLKSNGMKYIYKNKYFWDSYVTSQDFVYNTYYMLQNSYKRVIMMSGLDRSCSAQHMLWDQTHESIYKCSCHVCSSWNCSN